MLKGKIVIISILFGAILAIGHHFDTSYSSTFGALNIVVWNYVMTPILLYYANDLGAPLLGNNLLGMRILTSVIFWGGIAGMVYGVWWSIRTLKN